MKHYFKQSYRRGDCFLSALDLGTSKIVALIARLNPDSGSIEILGCGSAPSSGLRRGMIVSLDETAAAIRQSVAEAERQAGCTIQSVYVGIAGSHVRSMNSHGIVRIQGKEVIQSDIDRVLEAARALAIPADQRILHVLPQTYMIDDQDGIRQPLGMHGTRLETRVHVMTGSINAMQNIIRCVESCQIEIFDMVVEQLASSMSVLQEDEMNLGTCLIDMGGGTSDLAIFYEGTIQYSSMIPIAGHQVTNDIAMALRIPTPEAERMKIEKASVLEDPDLHLSHSLESNIDLSLLSEVAGARYEELFELIARDIRRSGLEHMIRSGIVLTGGGAKMKGGIELARSIFKTPVRLGIPGDVVTHPTLSVKDPSYATGLGLLIYGQRLSNHSARSYGFLHRVRSWLQEYF